MDKRVQLKMDKKVQLKNVQESTAEECTREYS